MSYIGHSHSQNVIWHYKKITLYIIKDIIALSI